MSLLLPPWQAALSLRFRHDGARTVLGHVRHSGPLRVQKLLYPQRDGPCHALLVHPPSGIASGDQLQLDVAVEQGAAVLLTTPGAGKWYRSRRDGGVGRQVVRLAVADGGALEWLPQEAVVHDGAVAAQDLEIRLQDGARLLGWDLVQLGLPARGERFANGRWEQHLALVRAGVLHWQECGVLDGDDPLLSAAQGLDGLPVFGTMWACAPDWPADPQDTLEGLRTLLPAPEGPLESLRAAATWLDAPARLLLVRGVAAQVEPLRSLFAQMWAWLRPQVIGVPAEPPRIWNT